MPDPNRCSEIGRSPLARTKGSPTATRYSARSSFVIPTSGKSTRDGLLIRTSRSPSGPGTVSVVASLAMQRTVHGRRSGRPRPRPAPPRPPPSSPRRAGQFCHAHRRRPTSSARSARHARASRQCRCPRRARLRTRPFRLCDDTALRAGAERPVLCRCLLHGRRSGLLDRGSARRCSATYADRRHLGDGRLRDPCRHAVGLHAVRRDPPSWSRPVDARRRDLRLPLRQRRVVDRGPFERDRRVLGLLRDGDDRSRRRCRCRRASGRAVSAAATAVTGRASAAFDATATRARPSRARSSLRPRRRSSSLSAAHRMAGESMVTTLSSSRDPRAPRPADEPSTGRRQYACAPSRRRDAGTPPGTRRGERHAHRRRPTFRPLGATRGVSCRSGAAAEGRRAARGRAWSVVRATPGTMDR